MSESFSELIVHLNTIADIPKGKRLDTSQKFITVDDSHFIQPFMRACRGNSRSCSVDKIIAIIDNAIMYANIAIESRFLQKKGPDQEVRIEKLNNLISKLLNTIGGISNLCETYNTDANVTGRLLPKIEVIEECVRAVNQKMKELPS